MGELPRYQVGQRVRVTQQIPRLSGSGHTVVEGEILEAGQQKTGSWFAHSKDRKLWIDRLKIRQSDGEIIYCNLDQYSSVEILAHEPAAD